MQLLLFFAVVEEDKNKRVIMQRRTAPVIFFCMSPPELIGERDVISKRKTIECCDIPIITNAV
jgi:hypothetical protein